MKTREVEILVVVAVKYEITSETVNDAMECAETEIRDDFVRLFDQDGEPQVSYTGEHIGFIVTGSGEERYFNHNKKEERV